MKFNMIITVTQIKHGLQHINRVRFTPCNNKKSVYVDLWDDELKELKEQIEQCIQFNEV